MKKKYLIVGMAVILGASLSFFGCDDSTEEAAEPTPEELAAELAESADFKGKSTVAGAIVTLTANVSVAEKVTVAKGVTLAVPNGKTLTVNGAIAVDGTVNVASGGKYKAGEGVDNSGSGDIVVNAGGEVYYNGVARAFIGVNGTDALFKLDSGTFASGANGHILNGAVVLNEIWTAEVEDIFWVGAGRDALTIGANSTFRVPADNGLRLSADGVLTFTDNTSKVTIYENSYFEARPTSVIKANSSTSDGSGISLRVYAESDTSLATPTGFTSTNATPPTAVVLTSTTASTGTPTAYVVGKASFAVNNATTAAPNTAITSTATSPIEKKGVIKAATDTVIVLTGKASG